MQTHLAIAGSFLPPDILAPAGPTTTYARPEGTGQAAGAWRVVVADQYQMVRAAIAALLSAVAGFEVVAQAGTAAELVSLVEQVQPDLVITEVRMSGSDAFGAIAEIHRRHPAVRLLALSADDTIDAVKQALANGACGYLTKQAPAYELEHAVHSVMTRGFYYSPLTAQRLLATPEPAAEPTLTPRQVQIVTLLAQGRSSKEIADALGLSSRTVDVHRGRIMARLELHDLASLARYALRRGLLVGGGA